MIGQFKAGDQVHYGEVFHNDQGSREDPTGAFAAIWKPDGTFQNLPNPSKIDGEVGYFGGTIDSTGFAQGQYKIILGGTVTTAKSVATTFEFMIIANTEKDIYDRIGAPSGASTSADIANIKREGSGAITWTHTETRTDTGQPNADVAVWVTTDLAGANKIANGTTDQNGNVVFCLDPGQVYIWRQKSGFNFTNPLSVVIS